jgi:hypothetical protein
MLRNIDAVVCYIMEVKGEMFGRMKIQRVILARRQ